MPASPSIEEEWEYLRGHVYGTALSVLGTSRRVKNDWFEENLHIVQPLLEMKRQAFLKYKRNPSEANKLLLRTQQNATESLLRECANRYWQELGEVIQGDADRARPAFILPWYIRGLSQTKSHV